MRPTNHTTGKRSGHFSLQESTGWGPSLNIHIIYRYDTDEGCPVSLRYSLILCGMGGRESQSRHCTYPIYTSYHQGIWERNSKLRNTLSFQDTSITRGSITILHKVESFLINDTYLTIPLNGIQEGLDFPH